MTIIIIIIIVIIIIVIIIIIIPHCIYVRTILAQGMPETHLHSRTIRTSQRTTKIMTDGQKIVPRSITAPGGTRCAINLVRTESIAMGPIRRMFHSRMA